MTTDYQPDAFTLTGRDDGQGFRVEEATARPLEDAGAGLGNLYRRAGLLGGTCVVISQPGEGTRVEIRMPRHRDRL